MLAKELNVSQEKKSTSESTFQSARIIVQNMPSWKTEVYKKNFDILTRKIKK